MGIIKDGERKKKKKNPASEGGVSTISFLAGCVTNTLLGRDD